MKEEIKNQILGLSIYNARTEKEDIVWIAKELCEKYGWSTDDMIYSYYCRRGRNKRTG